MFIIRNTGRRHWPKYQINKIYLFFVNGVNKIYLFFNRVEYFQRYTWRNNYCKKEPFHSITSLWNINSAWKVSIIGVFWSEFSHIRTEYGEIWSICIQFEWGKYGPEKLRIRTLFMQCNELIAIWNFSLVLYLTCTLAVASVLFILFILKKWMNN